MAMDYKDSSNHMCLICNQTIVGLLNYVEHFKTHTTPQECHIIEQKFTLSDVKGGHIAGSVNEGQVGQNKNVRSENHQQSNQNVQESYSGDTSPMSEFIDNTDDFNDPELGTDALLSPRHCPDFFQSLELKSANEEAPPRPKLKAIQRLSILEDDIHAESLLPITSILSNLEFSSDEDLIGVSDNEVEDHDEHFWLSDEDEGQSSTHPPQGHTGGKWKPGEGPKRRLPIAGKWKPGHGPGPACRKNILRKPTKSRGSKNDAGKTFYCNVCLSYFSDRNSYSLHFSQSQHKEIAEVKKLEKATIDYLEEDGREDKSLPPAHNEVDVSSEEAASVKSRRGNDGCYCPVCNLYFDNTVVFNTHCETKLHKDGMLKRGFREYKGSDGTVIRIDVHNETIYKEKQENMWPPNDLCKTSGTNGNKENKVENHSCHICQKHFIRKYEMARHLLTRMHRARAKKHPEAESVDMLNKYNKYMTRLSPFQCGICQYYFNRQSDFLDHMGSTNHVLTCEDRLGALTCVACKFKTHRHSEMMEHLQYPEHLAAVERKHGICIVRESHTRTMCKFCGVRMHSAVRMKRHCQKRHADRLSEVQVTMDVKPVEYNMYACPLCDKTFRAKSLLQLHFLKVHKNTSLFNCSECGRGFLDQRRLDNHLRTRFHAKRVVANKLKATFHNKVAPLKKPTRLDGFMKRGRGRPKKEESMKVGVRRRKFVTLLPLNTPTVDPPSVTLAIVNPAPVNLPSVTSSDETNKEAKIETAPRRSIRKRKIMEFFDYDEPLEHKKTKTVAVVPRNKTMNAHTSPDRMNNKHSEEKLSKTREQSGSNTVTGESSSSVTEDNKHSSNKNHITENGGSSDLKTKNRTRKFKFVLNRKYAGYTIKSMASDNGSVNGESEQGEEDDDGFSQLKNENVEESLVEMDGAIIAEAGKHRELDEVGKHGKFDELDDADKHGNLDELDEAMINEAGKHIFSCTYCEFAAIDLMELRSHYNDNHPNDILTCQPCNQYFLSLKAYKIHCSGRGHQLKLREQSGETVMHKCKMCDKRFLQESCCLLHMETVHRHPCSESDLQRIHKGQDLVTQLYGDHVKQVESLNNDSSVSCPECGKFVRKDTLVEHLRLHTGERPYTCRFCSKGFAGRLTLRRHISTHLNMPLFMCDLCGKEFKRNSHLIKHIRQHDFEKKGEKHICHVCKAWFYTPEELARHMRRHGDRNYKCTWPGCHWTFVLSGELKSHMFTHTGEKKYLCDMCGFGAPTKTRLRRHVKTHVKIRNFTCDYCPYKAVCKTHLKRHMRIHINARPFACPYCNYTCNTHENIRKHILKTQKHKGMKLYPCKLCRGFGCDSSKEFRAHLMTVHDNYLRENAVDSLAVFSGLYKREEDFQKPQEGSQIIQVTKGRFFRSYQNPNASIEPPKPKKIKKVIKMEDVKVNIVPPSELQPEEDIKNNHLQGNCLEHFHRQEQRQQTEHITTQQIYLHHNIQQGQQQLQEEQESLEAVDTVVETPQYIEVPNMVIHSYDPQQVPQLSGATVSFASSVIQHPQQQPQPLPVTVTVSDDKVYWTVIPEHRPESVPVPTATPEPWYYGMPQVHAPTSQELQQYRPVEVTTSHTGQFVPSSYFCNIPVGDIQNIPSAVTGPIYTSVVENVVVLSDLTRPNTSNHL